MNAALVIAFTLGVVLHLTLLVAGLYALATGNHMMAIASFAGVIAIGQMRVSRD